jgi:ribosomal-protein-alanine N-acetyltransferase
VEGTIQTERLVLEPFSPAHAEAVRDYYDRNRAHLDPWEPARPPAFYTVEYHREQGALAVTALARDEYARFAVFSREDRSLVALHNLWNIRRAVIQAAVIGYSVDEAHGGRGIATEAAAAVVDYAFDVLNLHRVETSYHPMNERSGRVLRKLGFTVEGYARDYLFMRGAWQDAILVSKINPRPTPPQPASAR